MTLTEQEIRNRLQQRFTPMVLEVTDESAAHAGHAGARPSGGSHFRLRIVAEAFRSVPPIQRHRLIYEALGDLMQSDIHALRIEALPPPQNS